MSAYVVSEATMARVANALATESVGDPTRMITRPSPHKPRRDLPGCTTFAPPHSHTPPLAGGTVNRLPVRSITSRDPLPETWGSRDAGASYVRSGLPAPDNTGEGNAGSN
jgi:hypothetical protein